MRSKAVKKVFAIFLISIVLMVNRVDITYAQESFVVYDDKSSKMVTLLGDDLFLDFKEIYPGEVRTQEIKVQNKNKETIDLFLRAEPADEDKFESKKEKVISEELLHLLSIKLTLKLEDNEEKLIYSGPLSGVTTDNEKEFGTMTKPILLGEFDKDSSATIMAELQVPDELGNKYQNAQCKIKWIFSCDIKNSLSEKGANSILTGDNKKIIEPIILCLFSGITIMLLITKKTKNNI